MGIQEREYYRRDKGRGRGSGTGGGAVSAMRMWSVTTWIIVACVSVYVIDGFLPTRAVVMGIEPVANIDRGQIDSSALDRRPLTPPMGRGVRGGERPVYVNGVHVWTEHLQYMPPIEAALHFSTQRGFREVQFWRFVGFQFLHSHDTIAHLLFNMIGLYFFGGFVERYLGSKRYFAFYLLCGIFGALMYVLLNLGGLVAHQLFGLSDSIPGLLFNDVTTPLIGASAGVFGILMAGAFLAPDTTVLLFFIIPMRLKTLAYGLVALSLFTILFGGSNAGGEAGHLGGAMAGYYFIRHPHHLHGFFDFMGWIDPTSHHYRDKRGSPARGRALARSRDRRAGPSRAEIDRVLDKVHASGLASLTDREKHILRDASKWI